MHTGGMAECARQSNLMHIILNNGAHDSVGGQPTAAFNIRSTKNCRRVWVFKYYERHHCFRDKERLR